jgi:hypothetical protein
MAELVSRFLAGNVSIAETGTIHCSSAGRAAPGLHRSVSSGDAEDAAHGMLRSGSRHVIGALRGFAFDARIVANPFDPIERIAGSLGSATARGELVANACDIPLTVVRERSTFRVWAARQSADRTTARSSPMPLTVRLDRSHADARLPRNDGMAAAWARSG